MLVSLVKVPTSCPCVVNHPIRWIRFHGDGERMALVKLRVGFITPFFSSEGNHAAMSN